MRSKHLTAASLVLVMALMSGCSGKSKQYVLFNDNKKLSNCTTDLNSNLANAHYEYKIMPNNRLSILIYNHPELSTRDVRAQVAPADERGALVARDGTVSLPLIGVVRVAGLTERECADLLTREYARYLKNAHVTVEVLNKRVIVLGEVKKPGKVNIIEDTTNVLEALGRSGGLTDYAKRDKVLIIRGTAQKPIVNTLDLTSVSALTSGGLTLYPNDVIYVMPNEERQRNMAINQAVPGIDLASKILGVLYTGKYLTNTHLFNVNNAADANAAPYVPAQ
ncbi:MAG TPA: polysaccharide export protein [Sulfuricurvum sp.]|nr:polysaccharide export protein [Sulfuricurvum sp.]